jgi:hypothetical protein
MVRPNRRHRPLRAGLLATLCVAALAAWPASTAATVVVAKDFAALCAEADLVFVGTVTAVTSSWRDAARRSIETRVTFGELTWLRGAPSPTITLHFAGGEVDDWREEIAGVPSFAVGQRRVVFARAGDFISPVVGFHQGLFRVVDQGAGPVVFDASGRAVTGVGRAALQRGAPGDDAAALPLESFLDRVREQLDAGGQR